MRHLCGVSEYFLRYHTLQNIMQTNTQFRGNKNVPWQFSCPSLYRYQQLRFPGPPPPCETADDIAPKEITNSC